LAVSTAEVDKGPAKKKKNEEAILEEVLSTWLPEGAAVTLVGDRSR
jgi:hypothetical protein